MRNTEKSKFQFPKPDPASVLGAALSLNTACNKVRGGDLSALYRGYDEFMRQVMRIATLFEKWSCRHIDFERLGECWPYHLEECFGAACLATVAPDATDLELFNSKSCKIVAMHMKLPLAARSSSNARRT